jgi:hypothetical protein
MALIRQLTGDTANLFGCDLPCFAIEGFTGNTFFTPCSSCVASTNYEANHAWDCVDCDNPVTDCASTPIYCFRIFISGFATSPTGVGTCDVLNGEQFIVDSISSGCAYTTGAVVPNPEHGVSKFSNDGIIQCIDDPADGTGFWRFHDGVTHVARGRISSANEDSACPPHSATFPVEGLCYCNGQFGTATMSYGPCPCLGTNEGSCPDSYPCS